VVTVFLGLAGMLFHVIGIAQLTGWTRQVRRVAPYVMMALAAGMWGPLMAWHP
jgi:hypothetical protein